MTSPNVENDPLTASSWPADASDSVLDPHTTEIPLVEEADPVRRAVPKPPDVDEILRGEYTGWVPVIKAGESQVDAQERARARIRRIEAELDAEEDTGEARSVSMWMTESMAVKLPPVTQPTVVDSLVIPSAAVRPPAPDVVKAIHDILDPPWETPRGDDDRVLSPGEALDEARRRIRQMRVDLENNVEMVTRSFEHEVFQVPSGAGMPVQRLFDDPVLPDEDTDYPPTVRAAVPVSTEVPVVQPAAEQTAFPASVPPGAASVEMDAIADAIEAAMDGAADAGDEDLLAAVASLIKRASSEPVEIEQQSSASSTAQVDDDFGMDAAVTGLDVIAAADNADDQAGGVELEDHVVVDADAASSPGAPAVVLTSDQDRADDAVTESEPPTARAVPDLRDALATPPTTPMSPSLVDDSEAQFLSDLLSTLDEVEATVTALANTTALDDVLAKYADILESDTSHTVTAAEIDAAREVEQRAAESRSDLDAMLRTLKAAAGTLADDTKPASDSSAQVLGDLLSASASASESPPAAGAPLAGVSNATGPKQPAATAPAAAESAPSAARVINQVVLEPATVELPPDPAAPDEPDLLRLVTTALRPLDLPPAFRGEPKRLTAQQQEEILRRHPQQPAPFVPEPGGKRADTPEESQIDQIIAAAAERGAEDRGRSFWDDEDDAVTVPRAAPAAARSTPPPGAEPGAHPSSAGSDHRDAEDLLSSSQPATTYLLSEQAPQDHSLELVIMRDEIRDLRDRLDSSQKLVEDLMVRLAHLTEIARHAGHNHSHVLNSCPSERSREGEYGVQAGRAQSQPVWHLVAGRHEVPIRSS